MVLPGVRRYASVSISVAGRMVPELSISSADTLYRIGDDSGNRDVSGSKDQRQKLSLFVR